MLMVHTVRKVKSASHTSVTQEGFRISLFSPSVLLRLALVLHSVMDARVSVRLFLPAATLGLKTRCRLMETVGKD